MRDCSIQSISILSSKTVHQAGFPKSRFSSHRPKRSQDDSLLATPSRSCLDTVIDVQRSVSGDLSFDFLDGVLLQRGYVKTMAILENA